MKEARDIHRLINNKVACLKSQGIDPKYLYISRQLFNLLVSDGFYFDYATTKNINSYKGLLAVFVEDNTHVNVGG